VAALAGAFAALAVATPVRPFFDQEAASGRILAAFERSGYLETEEGQLVAVLAEPLGRGAFALTVRGTPPLDTLHPDDRVVIQDRILTLGSVRVDLGTASPWDPTLPPLLGGADDGMRLLESDLRAGALAEGLSRLLSEADGSDPLVARGRQALDRLRTGLRRGDPAAITAGAADLAGLGPGLTPSGDDVLAGMLLALRLWPDVAGPLGVGVASTLIVGTAALRTGRISRAYLWAARQGHAAEAWHDLVRALPADPAGIRAAAARILQTGETSGADMLAGFVAVWEIAGAWE